MNWVHLAEDVPTVALAVLLAVGGLVLWYVLVNTLACGWGSHLTESCVSAAYHYCTTGWF